LQPYLHFLVILAPFLAITPRPLRISALVILPSLLRSGNDLPFLALLGDPNLLETLEDLGYTWFWGSQPATNPSFPGCKPSVFGTVTVQLFDFQLKTAALCPCQLPPNNVTSAVAEIGLAYNNTTQVPNIVDNSPIASNCTF
jgi:hypothetical protein